MLFPTASSWKLETTSVWIKTNHICVPYWVLFSFNHQNDKEIGLSSRRRRTGWWIHGPNSGPPAPNARHSSLSTLWCQSPPALEGSRATRLCLLGFSLDSTGFCLSHCDKTPLNVEASERLKELRGQESDGWACTLLSPLCFISGDTPIPALAGPRLDLPHLLRAHSSAPCPSATQARDQILFSERGMRVPGGKLVKYWGDSSKHHQRLQEF